MVAIALLLQGCEFSEETTTTSPPPINLSGSVTYALWSTGPYVLYLHNQLDSAGSTNWLVQGEFHVNTPEFEFSFPTNANQGSIYAFTYNDADDDLVLDPGEPGNCTDPFFVGLQDISNVDMTITTGITNCP